MCVCGINRNIFATCVFSSTSMSSSCTTSTGSGFCLLHWEPFFVRLYLHLTIWKPSWKEFVLGIPSLCPCWTIMLTIHSSPKASEAEKFQVSRNVLYSSYLLVFNKSHLLFDRIFTKVCTHSCQGFAVALIQVILLDTKTSSTTTTAKKNTF